MRVAVAGVTGWVAPVGIAVLVGATAVIFAFASWKRRKRTEIPLEPRIQGDRERSSQARVMISYSHHDAKLADALADAVQARFGGAWLDRRTISSGDSIVSGISKALSEASDYVLLLSRSSEASEWVKREWEAALHLALQRSGRLRMHIVRIDATRIPPLLLSIKVLDYKSLGLDRTVQELLAALGSGRRHDRERP